tara:strand:- start:105 stop:431 length:327 start_codon:yes stop_codon:yes gene_type:complete
MPMRGASAPYTEPRDGLNNMKRQAKAADFPTSTQGQEATLYKKMQKIKQGAELNTVRTRRQALDDRMNYEMQSDQMMSQMRAARIPGLRGQGSRMMGAERVASQVLAG